MNRKLVFHLCILTALICLTAILWTNSGPKQISKERLEEMIQSGEVVENELTGGWQRKDTGAEVLVEGQESASGMKGGANKLLTIPLLLVVAGYAAIVFVAYLLPSVVGRFTHMFYDSGEQAEEDPMHDARAFFAQGQFDEAIEAYRGVAAEQPENRFPWIEIAKIQHDNLEDPDAAIQTLRDALQSYEWRVNDAAFFMFRLGEMYEEDKHDLDTSIEILKQVVEMFPDTRHSANATHRLRELGAL